MRFGNMRPCRGTPLSGYHGLFCWLAIGVSGAFAWPLSAAELYVSPAGSDVHPGTEDRPLATLRHAQDVVRAIAKLHKVPVTVYLRGGTYYLPEPIVFTPEDSGSAAAPVVYRSYPGEEVVINGSRLLELSWRTGLGDVRVAKIAAKDLHIDQLFVNGKRQPQARWPNYVLKGGIDTGYNSGMRASGGTPLARFVYDPDRFSPRRWKHPEGAVLHIFQGSGWGNLVWRIGGVDFDRHEIAIGDGGWQMGTLWFGKPDQQVSADSRFFIENVREELDAPGEWYFEREQGLLYYIPPQGLGLDTARIEAAGLPELFVFQGTLAKPVHHVQLHGLTLTQTCRTVLDPYETRLRGDWSIARRGAVRFEGAEDCAVADCRFVNLGGNGALLSGYNRRVEVRDSLFAELGDSAVCVVGRDDAVRSLFVHKQRYAALDDVDLTPGPKSPDYPARCRISNNLMQDLGLVGKQTAGVYLSACEDILVSHNTIRRTPRAGICINDGCWGGHVIEFNDVLETVRETADHGPLNAWGRDRYWQSHHREGRPCDMSRSKGMSRLDSHKKTLIRNNRFSHPNALPASWSGRSHSWGIDLDDGASNYHVYNNLCLGCSVKLREGYYRTVENNIFVGPYPPSKHACFNDSNDVLVRNIYVNTHGAAALCGSGSAMRDRPVEMDFNLYFNQQGLEPVFRCDPKLFAERQLSLQGWQARGLDAHSVAADPMFVAPEQGDYRVREGSPALRLGFKNFPMDQFGITHVKENP